MLFTHPRTGERLEIYIERIHSETVHTVDPDWTTSLTKLGAENEFSDRLALRLDLIEDGLQLVQREYQTPAGPVDLLCVDEAGEPVIVEVKRVRATPDTVYQCLRYRDHLPAMEQWRGSAPRVVIVAPVLSKKAQLLVVNDPKLSFVRVRFDELLAATADLQPPAAALTVAA